MSRDLLRLTRSAPAYFCDAKSVQYTQAAERLELGYWLDPDEIATVWDGKLRSGGLGVSRSLGKLTVLGVAPRQVPATSVILRKVY